MDVIWLAVSLDQPGILGAGDRAHVGMKTMSPLWFNETATGFGAPDQMDVYTQKLTGHILYNCLR